MMVRWSTGYLALVLLCLASVSAMSAEKLPSDPRLSEKVTVDCTGTRLYNALDRISAQTGVKIGAGRNEKEWMVRDLPTLECSRDLPLGVLLQSIADANHLLLSARKSNGVWTYRIWRDPNREAEIAAFEGSRRVAALAAASWDWDTLCRIKDIPEDALPATQRQSSRYPMAKAMSNIVSQLGGQARDKVLAGDMMILGLANSPETLKPYLMECFKGLQAIVETNPGSTREPIPSLDEQIKYCHISLQFGRWGSYPDQLYSEVSLRGISTQIYHTEYERYWFEKLGSDYVKRPKVTKPELPSDALDPPFEKLDLEKGANGAPAFLDIKVKIPENKTAKNLAGADMQSEEGLNLLMNSRPPSYADVLAEVSRATGYSIVAEGQAARYVGTVLSISRDLAAMFGKEITVRQALEFGTGLNEMDWYVDRQNKLLLGRDREWIERLNSLVPESLLLSFRDKINGPGMDLDDLEPLIPLSSRQFRYWIYSCPEFPEIEQLGKMGFRLQDDSLWKLYFALTPEDKARLKSGETVSLLDYDQTSIAGMVNAWMEDRVQMLVTNGHELTEPWMTRGDLFANPNSLPLIRLRLEKKDIPNQSTYGYFLHMNMQVEGGAEGEWQDVIAPLPVKPKVSAKQ